MSPYYEYNISRVSCLWMILYNINSSQQKCFHIQNLLHRDLRLYYRKLLQSISAYSTCQYFDLALAIGCRRPQLTVNILNSHDQNITVVNAIKKLCVCFSLPLSLFPCMSLSQAFSLSISVTLSLYLYVCV